MYIDFHKYNYNVVDAADVERYKKRDKEAYKKVLRKWLDDNIDSITDRKWEVEEIGFLAEISDFIKLIREGESLYELGLYTSCIALIGVSAEDFSKYLSIKVGKTNHIQDVNRRGRTYDVTQKERLGLQLSEGMITQRQYDLLDEIRAKRNDCLHYNQNFKLKNDVELKSDALICLNNLKSVFKDILGVSNNSTKYTEIIEQLATTQGVDTKNNDEMKLKLRNATSHLFNFPVAFDPDEKAIVKEDYFLVREIDMEYNETTLFSIFESPGIPVIVELNENVKEIIKEQGIKEGNSVHATLFSELNPVTGTSDEWHFIELSKSNNISEIFHEKLREVFGESVGEEED